MENELFSDGIGRISVIGGVVRAELITLSPPETDSNGQPRLVPSGRLIMGIEAFLRSAEKVQEAAQAIVRAQQQATTTRPRPQAASSVQPPSSQIEPASAGERTSEAASTASHPFP